MRWCALHDTLLGHDNADIVLGVVDMRDLKEHVN
jgi:hypothetical protein